MLEKSFLRWAGDSNLLAGGSKLSKARWRFFLNSPFRGNVVRRHAGERVVRSAAVCQCDSRFHAEIVLMI